MSTTSTTTSALAAAISLRRTDRVPPMVRTVAYWLTLLAPTTLAFLVKLGDIWGWSMSARFDQTGILVAGTITTIGGLLGVVYRPTADPARQQTAEVVPAVPDVATASGR